MTDCLETFVMFLVSAIIIAGAVLVFIWCDGGGDDKRPK